LATSNAALMIHPVPRPRPHIDALTPFFQPNVTWWIGAERSGTS
jgi:hypothetical protein